MATRISRHESVRLRRLIDEYHIAVHPAVLGGGRKLFAEPKQRLKLRAEKSHLLDGQVVVTSYRPVDAGRPSAA